MDRASTAGCPNCTLDDNEIIIDQGCEKMANLETWAKLAAYVVAIGIGLEIAHRLYWKFNRAVVNANTSVPVKTILSSVFACIPLAVALIITDAFCKYIDETSLGALGITWHSDSLLHLSTGMVIGCICVGVIFLVGCSMGWFRVSTSRFASGDAASVPLFCGAMTDFFTSAVFEELTMRGYVFTVLNDAWGIPTAVYGSAVIFALFHLMKHPRIPLIFTTNAFVFGVLAAHSRAVTGTLWLPIGLHFGWNMAMGPILGLPCGGRTYEHGLVKCDVEGPQWVTGGDYSPDAGILGTVALIIAATGLLALNPMG